MKKIWKKVIFGLVVSLCLAAIIVAVVVYSIFTSEHVFIESKAHLNEIYEQVNTYFRSQISGNRTVLRGMESSIDIYVTEMNSDDPEISEDGGSNLVRYMLEKNGMWSFSNFYFVGNEREDSLDSRGYRHIVKCRPISFSDDDTEMIDCEPIELRFRRSLKGLIEEDKGGVIGVPNDDSGVEDGEFIMIAIKVKPNVYRGFEYDSIAFSFDSEDMMSLLSVSTFGERGRCYVVLPDGNIIVDSADSDRSFINFFDYLKTCSVERSTPDEIAAAWQEQKTDACLVTTPNGVEHYFTYRPVGFNDWILVGMIDSDIVNDSMNWFSTVTIIVMVCIFAVVIGMTVWLLVMISRQRIKENKLEVKSRENLLNLFAHNSNDLFFMFSTDDFSAEYVSSNVTDVLGMDIAAISKDVREVLKASVQKHPAFDSASLKAMPVGSTWERDIQMQNIDTGNRYWYKLSLYHAEGGERDYCVLMFSDRTDERSMREKLEEALDIAKNANSAKSRFLSNMSHDIRTPMNAIIGYATLLAKDADNAERVRDYTRKITYSGQHLLSLINDILDMSKIESGRTALNAEEFSLPEFIEELYSIMQEQAHAKDLTFDVHTKGVIPEFVLGDKLRLNQVILNILSNAIKYTPRGGSVNLLVEAMKQTVHNHSHIKFTVSDTGIGMSHEFVETIFEPFSREETSQTKNIQGTGLGMAITKNIVDLMGGVISVESEPGKGSTFVVELELAVVEGTPDEADFWKRYNVTRVLVVDDEEDICMDIKELMADTGVEIVYALSGEQAIEKVRQSKENGTEFNIVLLDWKMPGMDGVETARHIRKIAGHGLPIMVLTSYSFEDIEEEAREAGIDLFLSKPFFVTNFRKAIVKIHDDGTAAEIEPADSTGALEGMHVLAAEDNGINAEILIELLDIEGVTCDIAVDGQDAVKKFEQSAPDQYDMIFMDIQMPVMNGYEATRAIRASKHAHAKDIPIIAMTANAFDTDVKAALDAGMNAHLAKPIDMDKLKQTVASVRGKQTKRTAKDDKKEGKK